MGISAGVDRILSLVAYSPVSLNGVPIRFPHLVSICGNFHQVIYWKASKKLSSCQTRIIISHHVNDTLCRWRDVKGFWEWLSKRYNMRTIHFAALSNVSDSLLDKNCHDVSRLILPQRSFWQELKLGEESDLCSCLLYTSPSPRDLSTSRMPSSA